jgi:hypothetical protein
MNATAIATMTAARSDQEAAALAAAIQQLSQLGLPIFAADAGSIAAFTDRVRQISQLELWQEGTTLVQQIKACFRRVLKTDHRVVLYTEPDKREFFESGVTSFLEETRGCQAASACIAARDPESFATFPPIQRSAERALNDVASNLIGFTTDMLYGPLVLDLELAATYLDQVPDDLGWGWRTYVIARCVLAGKQVASVAGPFCCPLEQRTENSRDRAYRLTQLKQNVEGLRLALEHSQSAFSASPTKNQ